MAPLPRWMDKSKYQPEDPGTASAPASASSSIEEVESLLSALRPAPLSDRLESRLVSALEESSQALEASRIVPLPGSLADHGRKSTASTIWRSRLSQWAAAAAALALALGVSFFNASVGRVSTDSASAQDPGGSASARPVYQVINGELVPAESPSALMRASYRGIRVYDGQTYRQFQDGSREYWQPVNPDAPQKDRPNP